MLSPGSVEKGSAAGPLVAALQELLRPGAALGELFGEMCDGERPALDQAGL